MSKVQEILSRVDFVDLVSKKTTLTRTRQDRYRGLSPFKNEKTPSFFVNANNKTWYCFATGQGGGVLDYVEKVEGFGTRAEAIRFLAELTGVELEDVSSEESLIKKTLSMAQEYFRKDVTPAVEYMQGRGFDADVVDKYELGYIGNGYALLKYLESRKVTKDILVKSGLFIDNEAKGTLQPRFFNRVMIPIKDAYGSIVSFTGRDVTNDGYAKYLHGPITSVFKKSEIVWNLSNARPSMAEKEMVVLCEGQMDAIAINEAGIPAVATLGTSLSRSQLEQVTKYVSNVYVLYDSDEAGEKGLIRAFKIAQEADIDAVVYSVVLPANDTDPEDFINEYGVEEFRTVLASAKSDTSALVQSLIKTHYKEDSPRAVIAKKVMMDLKGSINQTFTYRSMDLIERLSQEFSFSKRQLMDWLSKPVNIKHTHNTKLNEMAFEAPIYERRVLLAVLDEPWLIRRIKEAGISLTDFQSHKVSRILGYCEPTFDSSEYFDVLKDKLPEDEYYEILEMYSVGVSETDFDSALQVLRLKVAARESGVATKRFLGRPHPYDNTYVATVRNDIIKAPDRIVIDDEY